MLILFAVFMTINSCEKKEEPNLAPEAPQLSSPANQAKDVNLNVTLSWKTATDPNGDAVSYNVYLGTEANPVNVIISGLKVTTYQPTLMANTTYYWKVVANDDSGGSKESTVWSFSTLNNAPSEVTLNIPNDGATDIALDTILTWQASTDPDGDDITYDIYLGTEDPPVTKVSADQTSTTFQTTLGSNTIYYWKVVAKDNHGGVTESIVWHFETLSDRPPPVFGSTVDPRDGKSYKTVTIGGNQGGRIAEDGQTWLAENLAYLPDFDGKLVYNYTGSDVEEARSSEYYGKYGVLYTWIAAMNGESPSGSNPSGVQGLCPDGWHLPSRPEWNELIGYVWERDSLDMGIALRAEEGWDEGGNGKDYYGFGALPAGQYNIGFTLAGLYTYWWTTNFYYNDDQKGPVVWYESLSYQSKGIGDGAAYGAEYYFSVRCVKD